MTIDRYAMTGVTHDGHPLKIVSLDIEMSDSWSPYVRGTLVCVYNPALPFESLDPRQSTVPTVDVHITRSFGDDGNSLAAWTQASGGSPVSVADLTTLGANAASFTLANHWNGAPIDGQSLNLRLAVDDLTTDERAYTMTLSIGGNELRLQDAKLPRDKQLTGRTVRYGVNDLLGYLGLGSLVSGGELGLIAPLWRSGSTAYDTIVDWFDGFGLRLIYDEAGKWRVIELESDAPQVTLTLSEVTELGLTLSRADWYDSVAVIWRWESPNPEDPEGDPIPRQFVEYSSGPGNSRPRIENRDAVYPGPFLADYLYERDVRKGQKHAYSAPINLNARPLQNLLIVNSSAARQATITNVRFSFPDATMRVETRER